MAGRKKLAGKTLSKTEVAGWVDMDARVGRVIGTLPGATQIRINDAMGKAGSWAKLPADIQRLITAQEAKLGGSGKK